MKFSYLYIVAAFLLSACNQDEEIINQSEDVLPENGIIEMTREIPGGPETRSEAYTITASLDLETEKIISYSVSEDLLEAIGMDAYELDNYLREQMGALYFLEETPTTRGAQADCITDCYKQFTNEDGTKKPGRGSCKLGCWVDSVKDFVKEIIDGVAGIF